MKSFLRSFAVASLLSISSPEFQAAPPLSEPGLRALREALDHLPPDQTLVRVGDMQLLADPLRSWVNLLEGKPGLASAFDQLAPIWPGGILYYSFDSSVSSDHRRAFLDAAAEWALFAHLQFIPRTTQANYFTILEDPTIGGGESAVGMVGGEQFLRIGPGAWNRGTLCHEIGHTLGLVHEHQRPDRDNYVRIITANLIPGTELDFVKLPSARLQGPYDFLSVMHYRRDAFSVSPDVLDTVVPLPPYSQYRNQIGVQNDPVLSPLDRTGMAARYGAGPTPTSVVTETTDAGPGSLRAALYFAWDHPGTTVTFAIPTTDPGYQNGVFTIRPTDRLPGLARSTQLHALSQVSSASPAGISVVLDGSHCDPSSVFADGLHFKGTQCSADGLAIHSFPGTGVLIDGVGTVSNSLRGCFIGLDADGLTARTNRYANVVISGGASYNVVGGKRVEDRNIISGSSDQGIAINGVNTKGNQIQGNFIGLDASGQTSVPNAGAGVNLYAGASENLIGGTEPGSGNVISGNSLQGVAISSPESVGNRVQGNTIGLDASGTLPVPNLWSGLQIFGGSRSNLIGGDRSQGGNVISGNRLQGVVFSDAGTIGNQLIGNHIGTDAAGSSAQPNGWAGVQLFGGASFNDIGGNQPSLGNVISGNQLQGVLFSDLNTSNNRILGNYIGVLEDGSTRLANGWSGVQLVDGASNNWVGDGSSGGGNVISGNGNYGVYLAGNDTRGNHLLGNRIGTDQAGTVAIPNTWSGVGLDNGTSENRIGGSGSGDGNVISGNSNYGLTLRGAGTQRNRVEGNWIGTSPDGQLDLGNGWDGIGLVEGASNNTIGISVAGEGLGNQVEFNHGSGIVLSRENTVGNTLRGNLIYGNTQIGINLYTPNDAAYGVTPNDSEDADLGPNRLQNYPDLTEAVSHGGYTQVAGKLNSAPGSSYILDFYSDTFITPSRHGDARAFLGSVEITTDSSGIGNFDLHLPGNHLGSSISATATDRSSGDTSEFGVALLVTGGALAAEFLQPTLLDRTRFTIQIAVTPGVTFRVQSTTNLALRPVPWVDVTNRFAASPLYSFEDPSPANAPAKFYRVISP